MEEAGLRDRQIRGKVVAIKLSGDHNVECTLGPL